MIRHTLVALLLLWVGCDGSSTEHAIDAGRSATDAGTVARDASVGTVDAGTELPMDAGTDVDAARVDAGMAVPTVGWADSWDGIHSFLVFAPEGPYTSDFVRSVAYRYDFGWSPRFLAELTAGNPSFVSGTYFSSIQGEVDDGSSDGLAWYMANHPDWILYECDRVTPVLQYDYRAVVPDFTNPDVVDFRFEHMRHLGDVGGTHAVAWDNYSLNNDHPEAGGTWSSACGIWDRDGTWVQKFAGRGSYASVEDPEWTDALIAYAREIRMRLHALPHPVLLIVNTAAQIVSGDPARSAALIDAVDGILGEDAALGPSAVGDPRQIWLRNLRFVELLQASGKAYYDIVPPPPSMPITREHIQFALASYLLSKGHTAGLIVPPSTPSGYDSSLIDWPVEFDAAMGTPCAPMYPANGDATSEAGVWAREHRGGLSLVNASSSALTVALPPGTYDDLYGTTVGPTVTLPAVSGLVIVRTGGAACSGVGVRLM